MDLALVSSASIPSYPYPRPAHRSPFNRMAPSTASPR